VLQRFHEESITYCLLRDCNEIAQFEQGGEVDILVSREKLGELHKLLAPMGFVRLPVWGYSPHHFFLAYDEVSDAWLKLDVVDSVSLGRPIPAIRTSLGDRCLKNRRRTEIAYIPCPEDEFVTLLLHCVVDKKTITESRGRRLKDLCDEIEEERVVLSLLADFGAGAIGWDRLRELIRSGKWSKLLNELSGIESELARRDALGIAVRRGRDRVLRKLSRGVRPRSPRGLTVALLAPDGAGKSTLAAGIQERFAFPVRLVYMGLYQRGRGTGRLARLPGLGFPTRLLTQWGRYFRALLHTVQGRFVIFDRYSYDALLATGKDLSWSKRWRRRVLAHCCPPPDLVCVLDAPAETLYARKQEHSVEFLEKQRHGYSNVQQVVPRSVLVDASRPAEEVRREVTRLLWGRWTRRPQPASGR
jgi:thymidylate kinase